VLDRIRCLGVLTLSTVKLRRVGATRDQVGVASVSVRFSPRPAFERCRYLHSEALRREIHEGLNVIETWNGANSFILYGKGGEIATNDLENQELTMLALHLLQICLVYINTLMVQRVLTEPDWTQRMLRDDLRALTPLIYAHVTPYGTFRLDMSQRLAIEDDAVAA